MAGDDLTYLDYVKAAFHRRARIPALGDLPVNYLGLAAFAVLGLANPGFWLVGAAAELAYLWGVSSSPRFQGLIRAERLAVAKEGWEDKLRRALERLTPSSQERYRRLLAECRTILGITDVLDEDGLATMRHMRTGGLNQMLWIFLRLLASREVLDGNLSGVDRGKVEADIRDLERRLGETEPEGALARSLRGTLEIQQRRLENLDRAKESREVVDAELERIEGQVVLIREETAVSGKAEALSSRLDTVTGALSETNRWMEQNARIFGELGADPLGSAPADLPEIPVLQTETET